MNKYINIDHNSHMYDFNDLTRDNSNLCLYNKKQNRNHVTHMLEHHIRRYTRIRDILTIIKDNNLEGDILEFGSWKGYSLRMILYILESLEIYDKTVIGFDGFIGMPYKDGNHYIGMFGDTTYNLCMKNIEQFKYKYPKNLKNIHVGKFLFKQKQEIVEFINNKDVSKASFVHVDCDVPQSCSEVFNILLENNMISDICYIAFDDWGCTNSGIPKTMTELFKNITDWKITEYHNTDITKTFLFKKLY